MLPLVVAAFPHGKSPTYAVMSYEPLGLATARLEL